MRPLSDDRVGPDLTPDTEQGVLEAVRAALSAGELPEFGSPGWLLLTEDDPRRLHATTRAALDWWSRQVYGLERHPRDPLNQAGKAIYAAAPRLWRQLANDRAARRPQGRDRSLYLPARPRPVIVHPDLEAAFNRAARTEAA